MKLAFGIVSCFSFLCHGMMCVDYRYVFPSEERLRQRLDTHGLGFFYRETNIHVGLANKQVTPQEALTLFDQYIDLYDSALNATQKNNLRILCAKAISPIVTIV